MGEQFFLFNAHLGRSGRLSEQMNEYYINLKKYFPILQHAYLQQHTIHFWLLLVSFLLYSQLNNKNFKKVYNLQ